MTGETHPPAPGAAPRVAAPGALWAARAYYFLFYGAIGESAKLRHAVLSWGQTGKVGWYAACLVIGAIVLITILVLT